MQPAADQIRDLIGGRTYSSRLTISPS